jgi:hypothetical protein
VVSTVNINNLTEEKELMKDLLETEKVNLTTLAQVLYGNILEIGCKIGKVEEWKIEL